MLDGLQTPEFWIMLAVIAVLMVGMGALKKYLKKISTKCDQESDQKQKKN